jgi:hypothetical protein
MTNIHSNFLMIYSVGLYYNHHVLEPLGPELWKKMNINVLKTKKKFVCLFKFSTICSLILTHKITKIYKIIFKDVLYSFISYSIVFLNLYDTNYVEILTQIY